MAFLGGLQLVVLADRPKNRVLCAKIGQTNQDLFADRIGQVAGAVADIFVADSRVRYLKPVFEDIVVEAGFDDAGERASLVDVLRKQGRASIRLKSESLLADGGVAASFVGRYVAILRD